MSMRHDFRRHSRKLGILLLAVVSVLLCLLPRSWIDNSRGVLLSALAPLQKPLYRFAHSLNQIPDWYVHRRYLIAKNRRLEAELARLRSLLVQQQDRFEKEKRKQQALSALARVVPSKHLVAIPAEVVLIVDGEVVAGDSAGWRQGVVIDRGSAHGLKPGLPVVWGEALVGKLAAVGPRASQVQLLTDPKFRVCCYLLKSRAQGIAAGAARSGLKVSYIPGKVEVAPGEMVLSSGLKGIFPKGLVVGRVTKVELAGPFQELYLEPQADLAGLEMVLVLERTPLDVNPNPR